MRLNYTQVCGKKFKYEGSLERHMVRKHGAPEDEQAKGRYRPRPEEAYRYKVMRHQQPFIYYNINNMQHQQLLCYNINRIIRLLQCFTQGKKFVCYICGKAVSWTYRKYHLTSVHKVDRKDWPCETCGRVFSREPLLRQARPLRQSVSQPTMNVLLAIWFPANAAISYPHRSQQNLHRNSCCFCHMVAMNKLHLQMEYCRNRVGQKKKRLTLTFDMAE